MNSFQKIIVTTFAFVFAFGIYAAVGKQKDTIDDYPVYSTTCTDDSGGSGANKCTVTPGTGSLRQLPKGACTKFRPTHKPLYIPITRPTATRSPHPNSFKDAIINIADLDAGNIAFLQSSRAARRVNSTTVVSNLTVIFSRCTLEDDGETQYLLTETVTIPVAASIPNPTFSAAITRQ